MEKERILQSIEIEPKGTDIVQDENNHNIYRVKVDNNTTSITVKAKPKNEKATVTILGNQELEVGTNKVTIRVTGENGKKQEAILYVRRADTSIAEETIIPNVQEKSAAEQENPEINQTKTSEEKPVENIQKEEEAIMETLQPEEENKEEFTSSSYGIIIMSVIMVVLVATLGTVLILKNKRKKERKKHA